LSSFEPVLLLFFEPIHLSSVLADWAFSQMLCGGRPWRQVDCPEIRAVVDLAAWQNTICENAIIWRLKPLPQ
jgi:hypothetical protein